jgi:hypothetical protein
MITRLLLWVLVTAASNGSVYFDVRSFHGSRGHLYGKVGGRVAGISGGCGARG